MISHRETATTQTYTNRVQARSVSDTPCQSATSDGEHHDGQVDEKAASGTQDHRDQDKEAISQQYKGEDGNSSSEFAARQESHRAQASDNPQGDPSGSGSAKSNGRTAVRDIAAGALY